MPSSTPVRSPRRAKRVRRSSSGITRSLQTIVDTAIASTMTIPVAAESPPTKATSASTGWPAASGSDNTKVSGLTVLPAKYSRPPSAIGSTNTLIASR